MNVPQIILIVLLSLNLWTHLIRHGQPRAMPEYNFWIGSVDTAVLVVLLIWGGFFA